MRVILPAVAAVALAGLAVPAAASAPFSFDTAFGRLPKNVVPTDYAIAIVPDAAARRFTGRESIVLRVRAATSTVRMNSLNETLRDVRFDGVPVQSVRSDDALQLTTITLAHPARPGRHTLAFAYTGRIETAPVGLFVQPFTKPDGGGKGVMLSTQFEATQARRMFPCWDEPAFRATYQLTATVPAAWSAVSNMPAARRVRHGALATTTFERSPKMPSYLVEFSAGDLGSIHAERGGTQFSVWAVKGQERDGAYALANAQTILADYNAYFGYKYPLPKLSSIAVPGGFQGAMENWGAITYNDQGLLLNASSSIADRQNIFSTQAHEMAHQWNGDLVTMGWWDDIWLNESFASWMAAKETDLRNPTWNWWETQDANKEAAMGADARIASHPIEVHVTDELQAENSFDPLITYAKGQALLRMLEAYLSPDTFRAGIRQYMKDRAFSNATSADLWKWLGRAGGRDVAALAAGWIEQPGFPLVSVTATCDGNGKRTIALAQKRFLTDGADPKNPRWNVPLQIRSGPRAAPRRLLFVRDGQTAPAGLCAEPLSANAGAIGYYRVAYDDATTALNTRNFGRLADADRIVLLDDAWALASAGQAKLPAYLALASAMGTDNDARAWQQIAGALRTLESDERGTPGYDAFVKYARGILKPLATRLGWDPKPGEGADTRQLRLAVLGDLGAWGDPDVVAAARERFDAFVRDRSAIRPDDQATVLTIVAVNADRATFDRLHAVAKSSKNETEVRRFYPALMNVRDPELAREAVAIALGPEIPQQAAALRLQLVQTINNYNPQLAWPALKEHVDALIAPLGTFGPVVLAEFVPGAEWNAAPLEEIEAFVKSKIPSEMAPNLARGMESARINVRQKTLLVPAADQFLGQRAGGASPADPAR